MQRSGLAGIGYNDPMPDAIDHDRLFKELLTTFFFEFLELFVPSVASYLDRESLVFLDKEVLTDVTSGDRHEVDILARGRFQNTQRFFLLHVEDQASAQSDFTKRMFVYFARLFEKHGLDVYPIVLFSYDRPLRAEPDRFRVEFPDLSVPDFRCRVIQLNRLDWRKYITQPNPVAAALMARMKIAPRDRPRVKLECLRLLATLRLNPAKARLIAGFVHTYLRLNAAENTVFQRQMEALAPKEKQPMIELTNEWIEKGREEGERTGAVREAQALLIRLGAKRLGIPTQETQARIAAIGERDRLETLCERIYDVETWHDLLLDV